MDAVKIIKDSRWRLEVGDITQEQYEELIAPLRDVEAVVRCKDCELFSHGYCRFHDAKFVRPDGYCYWGDGKDGDRHD